MAEEHNEPQEWVSAHVFYQGDVNRLLTETVRPLIGGFKRDGLVRCFFFIRYWEAGPHLRIRLLPEASTNVGELKGVIAQRLQAYLDQRPSSQKIDRHQYATLAPAAAEMEGETDYEAELHANDSVDFIAYQQEVDRFGTGESIAAVERHFADSSWIALQVLERGAGRASAPLEFTLAATLSSWIISDVAETTPAPTRTGDTGTRVSEWPKWQYESLGSYMEPDLDAVYLRNRDGLLQLGRQLATMHAGGLMHLPNSWPISSWQHSVASLRSQLMMLWRVQRPPHAVSRDVVDEHDEKGLGLAAARTIDHCSHLLANRLGLPLAQEAQARFLAARAFFDESFAAWRVR